MKLSDYGRVFWAHRLVILAMAVAFAAVSGLMAYRNVPLYRSTANVYFSLPTGTSATDLNQGATYTQAQMLSFAELARQPIVLDGVIDDLDLSSTARQLASTITATASDDTVLLQLSASSASPTRAAEIANSVAEHLGTVVRQLAPSTAAGNPSIDTAIVARAVPPQYAYAPRTKRDIVIGFAGGLLLGFGLALAREVLNTKPRGADEIAELTSEPILAYVAHDRSFARRRVTRSGHGEEAFRRLRTNLRYVSTERRVDVITVTSAVPGEGKSTVAINFAVACADAGDRVLLIDADLRKPAVAEYLGLEGGAGLTNILADHASLRDLTQHWSLDGRLEVLASGQTPPNPTQLLDSAAMSKLIAEARARYDVVVIDSPPLLPVSDATVLARQSSGAVLVTNLRKVHRDQLADAVKYLVQVSAEIIGLVVTSAPKQKAGSYYGHAPRPSTRWPRKPRQWKAREKVTATPPETVVATPRKTAMTQRSSNSGIRNRHRSAPARLDRSIR